ncbi:unnamed protein product, partial [Nesidiocoris tenuis]
ILKLYCYCIACVMYAPLVRLLSASKCISPATFNTILNVSDLRLRPDVSEFGTRLPERGFVSWKRICIIKSKIRVASSSPAFPNGQPATAGLVGLGKELMANTSYIFKNYDVHC